MVSSPSSYHHNGGKGPISAFVHPLPVLADSGYWFLDTGYDSTELAEVWMFLDFTIRAFLNIPR